MSNEVDDFFNSPEVKKVVSRIAEVEKKNAKESKISLDEAIKSKYKAAKDLEFFIEPAPVFYTTTLTSAGVKDAFESLYGKKPREELKRGIKVKVISNSYTTLIRSLEGTILGPHSGNKEYFGVVFDQPIAGGHDCEGHCAYGHGSYFTRGELEVVKVEKEVISPKMHIPSFEIQSKLGNMVEYYFKTDASFSKPYFGFKLNHTQKLLYNGYRFKNNEPEWLFKIVDSNELWVKPITYSESKSKLRAIADKERLIKNTCLAKVKSFKDSGKRFGYKPTKKEMLGGIFVIESMHFNLKVRGKEEYEQVVVINNPTINKSLKFLMSDIELMKADITKWLKSYTSPKVRDIKEGSQVTIINNKHVNRPLKTKLIVSHFKGQKYINAPVIINKDTKERGMKTISNPKCIVVCKDEQGVEVKLRLNQIKVV